ncbi:ribosome small subunit-dependent GTPase A [Mycoplasma leonicaptivi]|uniref:ribosome small subunit-dependent GTPase A n=1 Tax=Mycoplasma leonicaptivi TaxID=36742 RepID=UPI0004803702|nr:ribosome small subunit-dependent GTPase A [Mycoplasma leonicaptivi]
MQIKYKIFSSVAGVYEIVSLENIDQKLKVPAAGKFRNLDIKPIVGDEVYYKDGMICEVLPRKNFFIRPKISNVDQMIIFVSVKKPNFQSYLVDKYLAIIENKLVKPIICITKTDLDLKQAQEWKLYYQNLGYIVFLLTNNDYESYNQLIPFLGNKYSVFMGQSGVGKTTSINILTNSNYKTQEISKALGRGKHTTREVSIFPLQNGFLIDTPGFSSLDLDMNDIELAKSYKIFKENSKFCKYRSCLHKNENESDCFIKQMWKNGKINDTFYKNYLKLQNELSEKEKKIWKNM